jgi:hypothetical protein
MADIVIEDGELIGNTERGLDFCIAQWGEIRIRISMVDIEMAIQSALLRGLTVDAK